MKTNASSPSIHPPSSPVQGVSWKGIVRFLLAILIQPAILFGSAGRIDWLMGWIYLGLVIFLSLGSRLLMMRKYPDLVAERAGSLDRQDIPPADKILVGVVALYGPVAVILVAGLDHRFGWSPQLPAFLPWLALAGTVCGILFGTWAMLENRFFSAVVRIQKDRHQTVVSTGPYRFIRHPSYLGGAFTFLWVPLLLASLWALIPAGCIIIGYIIRTALEDRTLQEGLEGYSEYARRVQYRLLPGVW